MLTAIRGASKAEKAKEAAIKIKEQEKKKASKSLQASPKHPDINDALKSYITFLTEINMGIKDMWEVWDELDPQHTQHFLLQVQQLVVFINKNYKKEGGDSLCLPQP